MANEAGSGFDAVERGPLPSGEVEQPAVGGSVGRSTHPTVVALEARFPEVVLRHRLVAGDQHVVFVRPEQNLEVLTWLKETPEHHYDLLRDVTAVDYGGGLPLEVVYQLWSIPHRRALRLKCELPLSDLRIASVTSLWETANWLEREVYDLFGIVFEGHPDLRRILMPEDYEEGHPLRKDFPLRGRFSRAEQTRRALAQNVDRFYIPEELEVGREPQLAAPLAPGSDESGEAAEADGEDDA